MRRRWLCVGLLMSACAVGRYESADPSHRDVEATCTGTLAAIEEQAGGDLVLKVLPVEADLRLLAPGQKQLPCTIAREHGRTGSDPGKI